MLDRHAQPTKHARPRGISTALGVFSAAGGVLLVALLLCFGPTVPIGAAAQSEADAWPWPLLGEVITPYKNGSDRYAAGQHRGLDIAAPVGAPVQAIVDGRVSYSGRLPDGGQTVTIASTDGRWLVSSLHLGQRLVARGDVIVAGTLIGRVGTTGRRSADRPHLHLSLRRAADREYVDPMGMLGAPRLATAPDAGGAANLAPAAQVPVAPAKAPPAERAPIGAAARQEARSVAGERAARDSTSVHAQPVGGSGPATRHGAARRTTTTYAAASAGTSAREGHADRHFSRVAPPPLRPATGASTAPAAADGAAGGSEAPDASAGDGSEAAAGDAASTGVAAETSGAGRAPSRWLLLTIAAICLVALFMRRRPAQPTPANPPVRGAESALSDAAGAAPDDPIGEVVEFRRAERRA